MKTNTAKYEPRKITCRNHKDYNPKTMCDDLRKINREEFYNLKRVYNAWWFLKKHLTDILNKHAPLITKKVKGKPAPTISAKSLGTLAVLLDCLINIPLSPSKQCWFMEDINAAHSSFYLQITLVDVTQHCFKGRVGGYPLL